MNLVQQLFAVKSRLDILMQRGVIKKCFKINYNEALKKLFLNFRFILKIERVMSFQTLCHFLVVTLYALILFKVLANFLQGQV